MKNFLVRAKAPTLNGFRWDGPEDDAALKTFAAGLGLSTCVVFRPLPEVDTDTGWVVLSPGTWVLVDGDEGSVTLAAGEDFWDHFEQV